MRSPLSLVRRTAYPRFAYAVLGGALALPLSFALVLLGGVHPGFVFVGLLLKYVGGSLLVMGVFFYALYWTVDHAPDYLRELDL